MNNVHARRLPSSARFVPITELARRLGVTPRTLRHYQDQGLIRSHRIAHNARAYDADTVATIEIVVALREIGLPIATIRNVLALQKEPLAQADLLRTALLESQADKRRQISGISAMLETLLAAEPTSSATCVGGPSQTLGVLTRGRQAWTAAARRDPGRHRADV